MNRRPNQNQTNMGNLENKVEQLEQSLKTFRAEVDLKMTIIEQILTTRNEQFFVQKKLLEREHSLYESVMTHWKNTADMAASGLSIKFSDGAVDLDVIDFPQQQSSASAAKRSAAAARRGRKKRIRNDYEIAGGSNHFNVTVDSDQEGHYSDGGGGVIEEVHLVPPEVPQFQGGGDSEEYDDSDSAERKVFVEYYSTDKNQVRTGEKSCNPVWKYYMREENGQTALCKVCDDQGVQRILKVQEGSTSTLHRHLRFKHKEVVDAKPPPAQHGPQLDLHEMALIPPRKSVDGTRRTQSPIWNYFTKFKDAEANKARCNLCFKAGNINVQKILDGSTSRFHAHLKRVHGIDTKVTPIPPPTDEEQEVEEDTSHLEGVEFSRVYIAEQTDQHQIQFRKMEPTEIEIGQM